MTIKLGDTFPNFEAESTVGKIDFHEWINDSWVILFSHPADFTPVCTTEVAAAVKFHPEFKKRGVKLADLSFNSVEDHMGWIEDVKAYGSSDKSSCFPFPIISAKRELAVELGMLDPAEVDKDGLPLTARSVFILGPDKKLKLLTLYPSTTGRNFHEILRVVDSLQLTANHQVATPADWQPGEDCMIVPSVSKEEAAERFPQHKTVPVPSGKEYMRMTVQPS